MSPSLIGREVYYSVRLLSKHRALNAGIVVTLALVIGVATCMFALLYGVFFRQVPFHAADRLVMLWESNRDTGEQRLPLTEGAYPYLRRELRSFDAVAAFIPRQPTLPPVTLDGTSKRVQEAYLSPEMFQLLAATPLLGRPFINSESSFGAPHVAVLSHHLWKEHFGGRAGIVGQDILLNELGSRQRCTVVGVMPESFDFPYPLYPGKTDIWLSFTYFEDRFLEGNNFYVLGRTKGGVTLSEVQAELNEATRRIALEQPRLYGSRTIHASPLRSESVRNAKGVVTALAGALLLVTLIGCVNITHLVMARSVARERETAIRIALGATQLDVLRLACIEIGILVVLGGGLGGLIGYAALSALPAMLPPQLYLPRAQALALDVRVMAFFSSACLLLALAFGMALSRRLNQRDPGPDLRSVANSSGVSSRLFRRPGALLLVCEIAFAFALLSGTSVMLQSLIRSLEDSARSDPDRLLSLDVYFSNDTPIDSARAAAAYESFLENARTTPGVRSIALVDHFPFMRNLAQVSFEGASGAIAKTVQPVEYHVVSMGYADVAGASVAEGRWFNGGDRQHAEPVVVINEALARRYFSGTYAIGTYLRSQFRGGNEWPTEWRVVGVIRDPQRLTGGDAPPTVYVPYAQAPMRIVSVAVRTEQNARQLAGTMRDQTLRIVPGSMVIDNIQTGTDLVAESTARSRFATTQLAGAALLALVLACLGIYGVMSFHTARRTHEIAVRMAMGSSSGQVLVLVLREAMLLIAAGIGTGLPLAFGLVQVIASLRSNASAMDSALYVLAAVAFCLVGLAATLLPARRAASVDPVQELRSA